jgi:hypothetical protein
MSSTTIVLLALLVGQTLGDRTAPPQPQEKGGQTKKETTTDSKLPKLPETPKVLNIKEKKEALSDLTGYYSCRGEDANGKQYQGVAMIMKKNDVYIVQWNVGLGSNFVGVGIRNADTMAISWVLSDKEKLIRGVNLYRIAAGPRLSGHWATLPGDGFLQSETLTFLKRLDDSK